MHSRNLISFGLATVLSVAIVIPAFAQTAAETKDYQSIQDERDQKKQKDLLISFLKNYPTSSHRPKVDLDLITLYYGDSDWANVVKRGDAFAMEQAAADAKTKSLLFTLAMEGARRMNNLPKMTEFADKALAANPNNVPVLSTMARTLADNPPNDAAAKTAALDKALGYAQSAQKATKPETTSDEEWKGSQARLHGTLGLIYYTKSQWHEAGNELAEYLKTNPKDGLNQYRYGVAMYTQLQQTLTNLQALNTEARALQAKGENTNAYIPRLTQYQETFESQRDIVIDAMAKAFAIGGSWSKQAKEILDPLFKSKNSTLDGVDAFINSKKAELDALTPLPAPTVAPARGGPGGAGAGPGR